MRIDSMLFGRITFGIYHFHLWSNTKFWEKIAQYFFYIEFNRNLTFIIFIFCRKNLQKIIKSNSKIVHLQLSPIDNMALNTHRAAIHQTQFSATLFRQKICLTVRWKIHSNLSGMNLCCSPIRKRNASLYVQCGKIYISLPSVLRQYDNVTECSLSLCDPQSNVTN